MSLKLRRGLITVLTAFVLLFASLAIFANPNNPVRVNAEVIEAQVEGVDENYIVNAKETFPTSITTPISASDGVVIYPNGKAYQIVEDKEFTLNVAGIYTLRYFSGDQVAEKTFLVSQKNFVLSVEQEVAGKNDIFAATEESMAGQLKPQGEGNYPEGYEFKQYSNKSDWPNIEQNLTTLGTEALIVRMEAGTKFTYSVPIDLSKAEEDGLTNIINFQPIFADYDRLKAGSSGNYSMQTIAKNIVITLTDCYDSSRYMKFIVFEGGDINYARAGTDNLIDAGWCFPSSRKVTSDMSAIEFYEGTQYGFAYVGRYGTGSPAGLQNEWLRRDGLFLKFDYENAKVWATSHDTTGIGDYQEKMIADFNHKGVYPNGGYRGFTTGEVYLSIEFTDYQTAAPARVDIYEIAGVKAEDLIKMRNSDVDGSYVDYTKDTKAPLINVDFSATKSDGVYVDVGTNFVIPSAEIYDVNLKSKSVTAYRNYYDEAHRTNVPIVNGKMMVSEEDTYYIVYFAEDSYGNVSEKLIKVFGVNEEGNPAIEFDYGDELSGLETGKSYKLPKFTFNTRNNVDARKVKITIYSDKETLVIADLKNGQEIEEFLAQNVEFTLSYSGDYIVEYIYSDNAVTEVVSYELSSQPSDVITFPYAPTLPRYLIKEAEYDFDEIYAYSYTTGSEQPYEKADVYIAYDNDVDETNIANSTFEKLESVYSNKITGSEKAVLKYVYGSNVVYSDVAKIVDVNLTTPKELYQYKYFVGDFATASADDPSYDETLFDPEVYAPVILGKPRFDNSVLDYKSKVFTGSNTLEFINVIDISNFKFYYRILDDSDSRIDADNFNALKLVFTDPYNADNQVYVKIYKLGEAVYLDVNGQISQQVNQIFSGNVDKSILYNVSTGILTVSGVTTKMPFTFDFTTTRAYLDIVLEDISGVAGIRIMQLNEHQFAHDGSASTTPAALMTVAQGTYEQGSIITINAAEFVDVLTPIVKKKVSLEVLGPDGLPLTALDGTVLDGKCDPYKDYQVVLSDMGAYEVNYKATNALNKRSSPPGYVFVEDLTAPEITLKGGLTEGCVVYLKPGQKFTVKYSVQDNVSLPENIFTRIVWTNRELSTAQLVDGNVISFVFEGEYEVGISCVDELGNFARKTFTVIVTEEEVK